MISLKNKVKKKKKDREKRTWRQKDKKKEASAYGYWADGEKGAVWLGAWVGRVVMAF